MFRVSRLLALAGLSDPWWFTVESQERGHTVHCIAEQVFTHQPVEVSPAYAGYAKALLAAHRALMFVALCVERRLGDGEITGRPDAIGWLERPMGLLHAGPVIIDVKSGAPAKSHGVQLALYQRLADAARDVRPQLPDQYRDLPWQRVGVYVHANGRYKLQPYADTDDARVAEAIIDLMRWRAAHGLIPASATDVTFADDPTPPGNATTWSLA